jgi:hypothetical protein
MNRIGMRTVICMAVIIAFAIILEIIALTNCYFGFYRASWRVMLLDRELSRCVFRDKHFLKMKVSAVPQALHTPKS